MSGYQGRSEKSAGLLPQGSLAWRPVLISPGCCVDVICQLPRDVQRPPMATTANIPQGPAEESAVHAHFGPLARIAGSRLRKKPARIGRNAGTVYMSEPGEVAGIGADSLAEMCWGGQGPPVRGGSLPGYSDRVVCTDATMFGRLSRYAGCGSRVFREQPEGPGKQLRPMPQWRAG